MSEIHRRITIATDLDPRISFAMQQNDVPVVKAVRVENHGGAPLPELEVRITAEPAFAQVWNARVAGVPANAIYNLETVDLQLLPGFLGGLTERVRGQLRAEVIHEGQILAEISVPVDLLARDEWGGLSSLPEILAAFVLPNHPAIERVLRSSANLLEEWTGDPSLDGYQSQDPGRVYVTAGAVYAALQGFNLTYINPPASFEDEGQRVRLPDQVLHSRMATCLDVALVAAACLEQAGTNAIIVLVRGHAFVGVWLKDECFPEPSLDDGLRLRKRVDLNELVIFDPTGVTTRPSVSFERAIDEARRHLGVEDRFLCAIDIRRARKGRIRPLPELAARPHGHEQMEVPGPKAPHPRVPDVSGLQTWTHQETAEPGPDGETPVTRLDRWRRKLLDLSLRNRLLNFRDTKKTLQLLCPDPGKLEDMLAGGAVFQILPRPDDLGDRDPRDAGLHHRRTGQEAMRELLLEELASRRLRSNTTRQELDRRTTEIYRAARLGLEEGGASALYLAVGFLVWFETPRSQDRRLAPILLLPLELHRRSVREGFTLRLADDEPRINVTLLELLKQDFGLVVGGLDPLPQDESGLNVPAILHTVRRAVRDIDRWDVIDDVWTGLFSFTKFLMWRDLSERADQLMKNAVVEHLVNRPDQRFDPAGVFPRPERLDEDHAPSDTFCPLPADSSQLAAIYAAADGRSFVLEGPPGTGKSQTIANLIAHCLTDGKTVLFVSEKMAALNVVYRRLAGIGLQRYCLELHSNKTQKREVIGQLEQALHRIQAHTDEEWRRQAMKLAELRNELNEYVHALHRRRPTGDTVFEATSRLIGLREVPQVGLRWSSPEAHDADALMVLRDEVERLATAAAACGEVQRHAWDGVRRAEWIPAWETKVNQAIEDVANASGALVVHAKPCAERLGLAASGWSLQDLEMMRQAAVHLMQSPATPTALLVRPDWDEIQSQVGRWIEHGQARDSLRGQLRTKFRDDMMQLDVAGLRARHRRAEASRWPGSWWRRRSVRSALKAVSLDSKAPPTAAIGATLERALALRDEQSRLDAAGEEARILLGRFWKDGEADWDGLAGIREWAGTLRDLAARASHADLDRAALLRERWAELASGGRDDLRPDARIGREFMAYHEAFEAFKQCRGNVIDLLDLDVDRIWGGDDARDAIGRVRTSLSAWQSRSRQLRDWCAWRRARAQAMRSDLAPLIEAYERGGLASTQLRATFERSYAQWWLGAVTDREPVLNQFFSPEHDRKIDQFRAVDERYMHLTRLVVEARLSERVPSPSTIDLPNSEMGILKREVGKKRRHLPVRQLLHRIPNLLPRLKPCILMSPMSVAQYLDADHPPFDVVVFDEASQIPVWDAVGAIARGRQAVIAGDPKQLPPTTFFQRSDDDEEESRDNAVEDLESILDDCLGAQIPCLPLNWHYRSRHESLITFSNYHYYGNRLLTFPSPALAGLGVSWRYIPGGVYDKGKSRTNRIEAEFVVAEVLRRLRDPQLSVYSIGVVTFSQAQQALIEDLLDAARREDPGLDPHFAEERDEAVFVKNLENVQGDERDVILFSICYGPDVLGRVSMNFGPMNRDGGERRLNVAITRARREVMVFSTLRADRIDLSRTRARGVRDLKGFLEYAEKGPAAIAEATQPDPDADFESPFEEAVFEALVQQGWEVHKQVGCARYRIDLAIVDSAAPGRYLLGVECDGANYHRAKTARDRDKLREGVLRDLGWKLHRVWSTDWWTDPDRELQKLEAALDGARSSDPQTPMVDRHAFEISHAPADAEGPALISGPATVMSPRAPESSSPERELERYRPIELPTGAGSQAGFYEAGAMEQIRRRLLEVVRQEGPISLSLAAGRVAVAWGFERVRAKAVERVRCLIPTEHVRVRTVAGQRFLWPIELDPDTYVSFRVPGPEEGSSRTAEDMPPEEVANALLYVLTDQVAAPADDLIRQTARVLGFQRMGRKVDERMRAGLQVLVRRGSVIQAGDSITIRD